ncbi:conserved Plasmodium protein, unknown function [Plasmodium gallinaceum]|uniref:CLAMP domain-containing protein n=1 Tax=Plasmodium gallinaceum TaxID=5849 RepID=A0A1J1GP06_PLAGA|nr:conserved Plasmodium protein, unknown function [Plasmodium gallinaceum]CRG94030.1 conserved Plasmodium protein, unknown function [Plasmodium gallinaceum]
MSLKNEDEKNKTEFFVCADINKKKMRKIIISTDKKKQKKLLIKSLHINFNMNKNEKNKKEKLMISIDNFLPKELNNESINIKKNKNEDEDLEYLHSLNTLKKQKMMKIVCDFFYNILIFCINKNLSLVEISTFLSIKKYIFFKFVNSCQNIINLFLEFKKIMLKHSINRIPYYVKVFSYSSLDLLIRYSFKTFFKNFSFYKFIFNPSYKIYFECIDNNSTICEEKDFNKNDDAIPYNLNTPDNINYIKDLIRLNVGSISNLKQKEINKDSPIKEIQKYLYKFNIKNDYIVFEINEFKKDKNLQRIFNDMKNNNDQIHSMNDKKKSELQHEKSINKDKLIKRVDNLYNDLERRIVSNLNQLLNNEK